MQKYIGEESEDQTRLYAALLVIGIILVSFNLRPGITSVGPLIGIIRDDIGLVNWSVGLLTSLPLLAFAFISPIVPSLANRFSNERMMLFALLILMVGISIRSISLAFFLFFGTALVGIGIAVCNVLLPGVIKEHFPTKVALMTSIYSTTMGIFAAVASGVSIPVALQLDWGWQSALLLWAIPALIGSVIWFVLSKKSSATRDKKITYITKRDGQIWRSPLAWQIAFYMGLQSSLFYIIISWLPEMLFDYGVAKSTAGWLLSYTQIIGIPASFIVPVLAGRMKSQAPIVLVLGAMVIAGFLGLLTGSSYLVMMISTTLIGVPLSGLFALALTLIGLRARTAIHASYLSGMAQAVGYSIAAGGPLFIGFMYDLTNEWTYPIITLIVITVLLMFFGVRAGKDRYVLEEEGSES